jgi:hypothetical protein
VKILDRFLNEKGTLFLHLLAKPKDHNVGFLQIRSKTLLWTEMFILLLCRNKNPEILNIAGHKFLEDCGLEGVTHPGKGKTIKTFRNALGIDSFGGNGHKPTTQRAAKPTTQWTTEPTTQQITHPITQPTTSGHSEVSVRIAANLAAPESKAQKVSDAAGRVVNGH